MYGLMVLFLALPSEDHVSPIVARYPEGRVGVIMKTGCNIRYPSVEYGSPLQLMHVS